MATVTKSYKSNATPKLGFGVGLRNEHFPHVLEKKPSVDWFEAISENFIGLKNKGGGRPIKILSQIRQDYPIVLHGVSLSLGSTDPLDVSYLNSLKELYQRIEPAWVSDHLCWTGLNKNNLHDLIPLPFTQESLKHVVGRIQKVQDFFQRQILVENVSSYFTFSHSQIQEWEFLTEVAQKADCLILLDINNIYVSSVNHGFDPLVYLNYVPPERVGQFHLAGHKNNGDHLIDTHDHPVVAKVWSLYKKAVERFGDVPTLLERDDRIPGFEVLERELAKAKRIQEEALGIQTPRRPKIKGPTALARVENHPLA